MKNKNAKTFGECNSDWLCKKRLGLLISFKSAKRDFPTV